jgi:hypothetical protein
VVKAALIQTQSEPRKEPRYRSIKFHCYGVTFFGKRSGEKSSSGNLAYKLKATPHQGSSFLSSTAFDRSIKKAMRLIYHVPRVLQRQLEVNSEKLVTMTLEFNRVAAELKLFSFYETIDTNLAPKANGTEVVIFTAPIVSIKSAVLELHHEVERPLDGNHADCAAFGKVNNYAQWSYLEKLQKAVQKSLELCTKDHIELNLKALVEVEVHGFYEAGDKPSLEKAPIRLWTTKDRLKQFLIKGPAKCLNDFLHENTQAPETATRNQSSDSLLSTSSMSDVTQDRRNHSDSTMSPIRRRLSTTQLTRPNIKNQKLTWVHLPFNNPTWCSVSIIIVYLVNPQLIA